MEMTSQTSKENIPPKLHVKLEEVFNDGLTFLSDRDIPIGKAQARKITEKAIWDYLDDFSTTLSSRLASAKKEAIQDLLRLREKRLEHKNKMIQEMTAKLPEKNRSETISFTVCQNNGGGIQDGPSFSSLEEAKTYISSQQPDAIAYAIKCPDGSFLSDV